MWAHRTVKGVTSVGIAACALAYTSKVRANQPAPPFNPKKSRYDESTFYGRYRTMCDLTDPLDLLKSEAVLSEAKEKLAAYDRGDRSCSDEDLWDAQKTIKAMTHPVTGEVTFWPGRMCAFVVTNVPISMGMILHGPTSVAAGAFWQWANQSINVAINYVNRSGAEVDFMKLGTSYGLAVATSCSLAIGFGKIIASRPALQKFGMLLPYFALISASTANMLFTRWDEWESGIPIFDNDEKEVGLSARAGVQAIVETLLTRVYLVPVACVLIPPVGIHCARVALPAIMKHRIPAAITEASIIGASIYLALPVCLAIQPQTMEIPREKLEPQFHNLFDRKGAEVTHFYANKGL